MNLTKSFLFTLLFLGLLFLLHIYVEPIPIIFSRPSILSEWPKLLMFTITLIPLLFSIYYARRAVEIDNNKIRGLLLIFVNGFLLCLSILSLILILAFLLL